MNDGILKNLEIITGELKNWREEMRAGIERFKNASLRLDKTNVFHLCQNLVTETFRALPRTLGYAFSAYVLYSLFRLF